MAAASAFLLLPRMEGIPDAAVAAVDDVDGVDEVVEVAVDVVEVVEVVEVDDEVVARSWMSAWNDRFPSM